MYMGVETGRAAPLACRNEPGAFTIALHEGLRLKQLVLAIVAAATTSVSYGADEFDEFVLRSVKPEGAEWISKGDDPSASGAPGPRRFKWTTSDGRDRIFLQIVPDSKPTPRGSRASDMHAAAEVCLEYSTAIDYGSLGTPFLGWSSECTSDKGDVMFVKNFVYVRGSTAYRISRSWYQKIDEAAASEWRGILARVVDRIENATN